MYKRLPFEVKEQLYPLPKYSVALCRVNVRFGSKADMCVTKSDVHFTPNSNRESGHVRLNRHLCFGPTADMRWMVTYRHLSLPQIKSARTTP